MLLLSAMACGPRAALITDAHNARISTQLDIGALPSAASHDVVLDWSGLDTDVLGQPLDPSTVDRAELLIFNRLTQDEVVQGLVDDDLVQTDLLLYQVCEVTRPSCALSEFGLYGSTAPLVESFIDDGHTWLLVLSDEERDGAVGLAFPEPSDAGSEQALVLPETSSLELQVELAGLDALPVASRLDWSELTVGVQGHELSLRDLDVARLGRFSQPVEELEGRLPELSSLAEATWTGSIEGRTSLDLAELEGPELLTELDEDATWLLALECSSCPMPLPRALLEIEAW
jgi:hypothetical protein